MDDWLHTKYALVMRSKIRTRALANAVGNVVLMWLGVALKNNAKIVGVSTALDVNSYLDGVEWVPIEPGTDAAFELSLAYVLINENLYNSAFLQNFTNAAILIKPDSTPLLGSDGKYQVWDTTISAARDLDKAGTVTGSPALTGSYNVSMSSDTGTVKPAFQLFVDRLQSLYTNSCKPDNRRPSTEDHSNRT